MKARIAAFSMMILPVAAIAQPADVDGWNGVKWGMHLAEVKLAISSPLERESHLLHGQKISAVFRTAEPVKMLDIPVWGNFLFSLDDKLTGVELRVDGSFLDSTPSQPELFARFKQSLTESYGRAAFTDDNGRTVVWSLPSTSIRLQWTEFGGHPFMAITYRKADKKSPA